MIGCNGRDRRETVECARCGQRLMIGGGPLKRSEDLIFQMQSLLLQVLDNMVVNWGASLFQSKDGSI